MQKCIAILISFTYLKNLTILKLTNMKTYPTILLPTDKASNLFIEKEENSLMVEPRNAASLPMYYTPQHIYIIDPSAEIKEGDWYITKLNNIIKHEREWSVDFPNFNNKKIIASTDKTITPNSWIDISKSMWIIDEYNKTGKMPDVGLEIKEEYSAALNEDICIEMVIKTNSDKSVIIKPIEEEVNWTDTSSKFDKIKSEPIEEKKPTMEETREFLGLPPIEQKVDVEKLARERYPHSKYAPAPDYLAQGFIDGYNQAIKDNAKQYSKTDVMGILESYRQWVSSSKGSHSLEYLDYWIKDNLK